MNAACEKVGVLFHHLGPYHWARLEAAARRCPLVAVELSAESQEYPWEKVDDAASFERVTLFEDGDSRLASSAELQARVGKALGEHRPGVVAIPGWSDNGALAALKWCLGAHVPVIVMSESTGSDQARVWWREAVKKAVIGLCRAGLAGGEPQVDYLAGLGMPRDAIFTGYDAVDNDHFAAGARAVRGDPAAFRDQLGLPQRFFLASARFIAKKNLTRLFDAYVRYHQAWDDDSDRPAGFSRWHLVLLGDGPLKERLSQLIKALKLDDWVHLCGFKQYHELPAYYGLAGAFVHASTTEQWGLVVNEAMAAGLPVLVSNRCGCARDLVRAGVNGFTFDPTDTEELARLMQRVAALDESARAAMGQAGSEIVSHWGVERFATGLLDAVNRARQVGPKKGGALSRALLEALLRR